MTGIAAISCTLVLMLTGVRTLDFIQQHNWLCEVACQYDRCRYKCECHEGYEKHLGLHSFMPKCDVGYLRVGLSCQPQCSEPCIHGRCVKPEKCKCDEGFYPRNNHICVRRRDPRYDPSYVPPCDDESNPQANQQKSQCRHNGHKKNDIFGNVIVSNKPKDNQSETGKTTNDSSNRKHEKRTNCSERTAKNKLHHTDSRNAVKNENTHVPTGEVSEPPVPLKLQKPSLPFCEKTCKDGEECICVKDTTGAMCIPKSVIESNILAGACRLKNEITSNNKTDSVPEVYKLTKSINLSGTQTESNTTHYLSTLLYVSASANIIFFVIIIVMVKAYIFKRCKGSKIARAELGDAPCYDYVQLPVPIHLRLDPPGIPRRS